MKIWIPFTEVHSKKELAARKERNDTDVRKRPRDEGYDQICRSQ
jgi:hypothetical protein